MRFAKKSEEFFTGRASLEGFGARVSGTRGRDCLRWVDPEGDDSSSRSTHGLSAATVQRLVLAVVRSEAGRRTSRPWCSAIVNTVCKCFFITINS